MLPFGATAQRLGRMRRILVPADLQAVNLSEPRDTKCVVADEYIRRDEIYPLSVASMYQV